MGLPDLDNIPDTGAVFTIGRSQFADNVASHFFIRRDPVIKIACGDEHSAVVCESGRLFVFGSNDWGQLGLGHKNHVSKPSCVKILKPEKVTHVACGRAHTLICTGGQKIFSCGSDQEGQLGRGDQTIGDSSSSPVPIYDCGLAGQRVVQMAAGSHHSLALTNDGGILAWGSNKDGQLGLSEVSGSVNTPTKIHIPEPVKKISAGYHHSAFLTESGLVYVCGESESGKLGIVTNFSTLSMPKQIQLPGPAFSVECGGHHTFVLAGNGIFKANFIHSRIRNREADENGNLVCFGSNASGQLGMGTNVTEIPTPKILPRGALQDERVTKVASGESHSAVITESGKLFTCGDGRYGKLGLEENENNVHELTLANRYQELIITDVSCGGCHTILVGRKRETETQDENAQKESFIQKKSLPPLKVPVGRFKNDVTTENTEQGDGENNIESEIKESLDVLENTVQNAHESVNCIEKPESPKKLSDYIIEMTTESKEEEQNLEVTKQILSNNNGDIIDTIEETLNIENNTDGVKRITSAISESFSGSDISRDLIEAEKDSAMKDTEAMNVKDDLPSSPTIPPPKPPRLKSGSIDNCSLDKAASSLIELASPKTPKILSVDQKDLLESKDAENNIENTEVKNIAKEEEQQTTQKESPNSQKSQSAISKGITKEIEEVDGHIEGAKEEDKTENTTDKIEKIISSAGDTDVVTSVPTKTGKIAKLFKSRRQLDLENGIKESGGVNPKVKSKTCTVL